MYAVVTTKDHEGQVKTSVVSANELLKKIEAYTSVDFISPTMKGLVDFYNTREEAEQNAVEE